MKCLSYAVYVCAQWNKKNHSFLGKAMIKVSFHLLDGINHFFQLGSAVENKLNANRLKPCQSFMVSGDKRNISV